MKNSKFGNWDLPIIGNTKSDKKKTQLYLCDYERNDKCSKTSCGFIFDSGECYYTTKPSAAVKDEDNKPVKAETILRKAYKHFKNSNR